MSSLEPARLDQSPTSSGRSSPVPRWGNEHDDILIQKDPKQYKKYAAGVERALSLFENTLQEWADYISFLGRLHKAIHANPSIPVIPAKVTVSKRLSQCLNARLPSGVHQKALEVYLNVFSIIGQDGLARDLAIWTPGIAPLLSYAAISVKPYLLDLLETYYLPLAKSLRPALRSLILAILPGIDEEGSEFFDRTFALLESIRGGIDEDAYFWQCFLLASISAPSRRQGALAYLSRKLPNLADEAAMTSPLVTPEPGLLIRCFATGLNDEQLLVQRGFLDVLVQRLPLSSPVLQKLVTAKDLDTLLVSVTSVVLRRDMSLNRRLWVWLLGPEQPEALASPINNSSITTSYFVDYGLESLGRGLAGNILSHKSETNEQAKPYRILLSLMDRWEIGGSIVPNLFLPAMLSAQQYEAEAGSVEKYNEVLRSASQFFDGVEPGLIWSEILKMLLSALGCNKYPLIRPEQATERLSIVRYILKTFNVQEEEMIIIYAPLVLLAVITQARLAPDSSQESYKVVWEIASELIDLIPERAFTSTMVKDEATDTLDSKTILSDIVQFFSLDSQKKTAFPPFSTKLCGYMILQQFVEITSQVLSTCKSEAASACTFLVKALQKVSKCDSLKSNSLLLNVELLLSTISTPFITIAAAADLVATLMDRGYCNTATTKHLVLPFMKAFWQQLSPDTPRYHVETVQAIWTLQDAFKDQRLEAAICTLMVHGGLQNSAEPGRRFTVLWNHSSGHAIYKVLLSRPLFLLLDALAEDNEERNVHTRGWLQNLGSTDRLLDILLLKLTQFPFLGLPSPSASKDTVRDQSISDDTDINMSIYYFQTLYNVLRYATDSILVQLSEDLPSNLTYLNDYFEETMPDKHATLQLVFAELSYAAITKFPPEKSDISVVQTVTRLHRTAISVLHQLLLSPYSRALVNLELEVKLIKRLRESLKDNDTFVQVGILDVLFASLKLSLYRPNSQLAMLTFVKPPPSRDGKGSLRISNTADLEKELAMSQPAPPQDLVQVLIDGLSSPSTRPVLDSWINFLTECLPLLSPVIFQILLPLVECICTQVRQTFEVLKTQFQNPISSINTPEATLVAMLNGLEHLIAAAHDQIVATEMKSAIPRTPAETTGFFGNMVSGVFTGESSIVKNAKANNRLTVLLCFQDTVRICYAIWSWGDTSAGFSSDAACAASYGYTSSRMKARSRRILEHLYQVETLECLETLMEIWSSKTVARSAAIFKLINVLDASRPKHTIGAIFNSIFSRTNPSVLEPNKRSSLTSELTDIEVSIFLVEYTRSLEDDAMEEIWSDCLLFLSDVLKNPFPHRQTVPCLLAFTATVGEKVDNTIFGEQKKMRKDLGDIFLRVLSAVFTLRPAGIGPDISIGDRRSSNAEAEDFTDISTILVSVVPKLRKILGEQERTLTAITVIVTSLVSPALKSKAFPNAVPTTILEMLRLITRIPNAQKIWKKEISDTFNDNRFFAATNPLVVKKYWKPLLRSLAVVDKERMTDLLSKLTAPAAAGVIFGVGAASARSEADKRVSLVLRRITIMILCADKDYFVGCYGEMEGKIVDLLGATKGSSPSAAIKGEVFALIRAVILRSSAVHLSGLWAAILAELQTLLITIRATIGGKDDSHGSDEGKDRYDERGLLAGCKLLDTLLVVKPDEWLLHEWLFVTDTVEAVYQPDYTVEVPSVALADAVGRELIQGGVDPNGLMRRASDGFGLDVSGIGADKAGTRKLMIGERDTILLSRGSTEVKKVIRGFLRYLSIWTFENTYAMGVVDENGLEEAILGDLFDEV